MASKFSYSVKRTKLPNGVNVDLQLITHPGAALIIPVLNNKKVIMLRQYRPALKKYIYELPAGTIDGRERPETCAHRELAEEAGYTAKKMTRLGKIYPVPGYSTEVITIFKAEGLVRASAQKDPDEIFKRIEVSRTELKRMFKKGMIEDAKTICALAFGRFI